MAFLLLTFTSAVALLSWHLLCIYSNYTQACRIGLPIVITPINVLNPVWMLTQQWFVPLLKCVPFGLCNFVNYTALGWPFADKYSLHDRLGDAFVIVGPAENCVVFASAETVEDIASWRKEF